MNWFLYDNGLRHERVNIILSLLSLQEIFFVAFMSKFLYLIDLFDATGLFLYPVKTSGFLMFSEIIERDR